MKFQILFLAPTAGELRLVAERGDHLEPERDSQRGVDARPRDEPRDHQGRHRTRNQSTGKTPENVTTPIFLLNK